ncbi:PQQ-dependent sugar dehydrogenase [Oxalobacteraceae bacterium]|nr:PQQ-dependent sugar dehydrogenase [Oxalobacteraceae bacterium]
MTGELVHQAHDGLPSLPRCAAGACPPWPMSLTSTLPWQRCRDRLALLAALGALAGCGGGGGDSGGADPALPPPTPTPPPQLALQLAASASDPVFLTAPAGDARQFIVERGGRIRILSNGGLLATPFLDIASLTSTSGERGLLSLAFHPDYARNGLFFIYYTDLAGSVSIDRLQVSANANLADPASRVNLLSIPHASFSNHNGGLLAFGPDGYLYAGIGDGGGAGDPNGNAQNTGVLLGKLLRLDVDHASGTLNYAIPAGNPYAGQAGKRGEIWAYGLRNPWRYAFDHVSGQLYIADVGQGEREEVDIAAASQAGNNYGWNTMEGRACYNAASCDKSGLVLPAFEYAHGANDANGCSITGGFVYRGKALPELAGHYFYSDYCKGYLKSFVYRDGAVTGPSDWGIAGAGNVQSFGQDAQGELYLLNSIGAVYRIVRKPM